MRRLLAVVAGAGAAAVGALILGEYELTGLTPFVAGPVGGLVVAETVVWVDQRRDPVTTVVAAGLTALGILWAGWIDSDGGVEPFPALAWAAAALGVLVAGWRARPVRPRTR